MEGKTDADIKETHTYTSFLLQYSLLQTPGIHLGANSERRDNTDVGHRHHGILFSHQKNNILSFTEKWINLEDIMLSGRSQTLLKLPQVFSHEYVLRS